MSQEREESRKAFEEWARKTGYDAHQHDAFILENAWRAWQAAWSTRPTLNSAMSAIRKVFDSRWKNTHVADGLVKELAIAVLGDGSAAVAPVSAEPVQPITPTKYTDGTYSREYDERSAVAGHGQVAVLDDEDLLHLATVAFSQHQPKDWDFTEDAVQAVIDAVRSYLRRVAPMVDEPVRMAALSVVLDARPLKEDGFSVVTNSMIEHLASVLGEPPELPQQHSAPTPEQPYGDGPGEYDPIA